ncbi:hypothetical protein TRAPUB_4353 [Trametes pubescens]|uniref:Uncharacterized protein n=1 Tax=Trametes pubescens TaxID=154538 RepID=A0A1M2VB56_TRAPU|nr:hypothetical protein TRAPUB_4353 [Trametes pubescens]
MHTLPLEILQQIFSLICTDGGYTGCSLSRTSKAIRAASWTARFHTVSLIAYPSRLESFTALYERACDPRLGTTPRVAHLHLTIPSNAALIARGGVARVMISMLPRMERSRTPSPLSSDVESGSDSENNVREDEHDSHKPQRISYTPSYIAAARALVRLVAPNLETLVLQFGFAAAERDAKPLSFIDRPFPRLREFTVLGLHRLREVLVHGEDLEGVPVLFPAVTHLHLVRKDLCVWPYDDLALLETHAPNVTHLRSTCFSSLGGRLRASLALGLVSSLSQMLGASLAASMGIARESTDDNMAFDGERPAYANLRHIILQPEIFPAAAHQRLIQESIEHLEGACRVRGVHLKVLEPGSQTYGDWSRRAWDEWEERLNGGEGCWKELGEKIWR